MLSQNKVIRIESMVSAGFTDSDFSDEKAEAWNQEESGETTEVSSKSSEEPTKNSQKI